MSTPLVQFEWGDTDSLACTIDVWPEDPKEPARFQARTWKDGDTTDLCYFTTWAGAIRWLKVQMAKEWVKIRRLKPTNNEIQEIAEQIVGMAPQQAQDGTGDWTWTPVVKSDVEDWWLGSDFPTAPRPHEIMLFPNETPALQPTHQQGTP